MSPAPAGLFQHDESHKRGAQEHQQVLQQPQSPTLLDVAVHEEAIGAQLYRTDPEQREQVQDDRHQSQR